MKVKDLVNQLSKFDGEQKLFSFHIGEEGCPSGLVPVKKIKLSQDEEGVEILVIAYWNNVNELTRVR